MGDVSKLPRSPGDARMFALSRRRARDGLGREDFQILRPLSCNAGDRGREPGDPPSALSLTQPSRTSAGTENQRVPNSFAESAELARHGVAPKKNGDVSGKWRGAMHPL